MILNNFKDEFIDLLLHAYKLDIVTTKKDLGKENIFSYCMFCDSAFSVFSSSACTRTWLNNQAIKIENIDKNGEQKAISYIETCAAEWGYFSNFELNIFKAVNSFTKRMRDADYDGELTGIYKEGDFDGAYYGDYNKFYITCIVEVLNQLVREHEFSSPPFENDILLGLQYPSPTEMQSQFMIQVSEKVNSPEWHKKMLEAYR